MGRKERVQVGMRFNRLTVIEPLPNRGYYAMWRCKCDCGNIKDVYECNLISNKSKSCGCLVKEVNTKHGNYDSRLYRIWAGMLDRCNPNNTRSKNHGDRGIRVCEEWHDYKAFEEWALANGYDENAKHGKCTIDRIDNNGNYEPSNCRWTTVKEQGRNKRNNVLLTCNGETHCLSEWAEITNQPRARLNRRRTLGWSDEEIILGRA